MILLWKSIPPFKRVGEKYHLLSPLSSVSEIIYDA